MLQCLTYARTFYPCHLLLLTILVAQGAKGFRFTVNPGRKCFTEEVPEAGRYYLQYKMTRSLTPFVAVAVTTSGGASLVVHNVAKTDAREIFELNQDRKIAICFKVSPKAVHSATSMNITLELMDAEEAELTRQKRQSYSTTNPTALGIGKASGALRQMHYIRDTTTRIRFDFLSLLAVDEDVRYSLNEMNAVAWNYVYVFAFVSSIICCATYLRLRHFFTTKKYI
ncbi:emp24/gp25L/p24 family/GOLD, putative [Trypanosoma equiperdum]|uniref:GOLD domain-containing protein n=3 Tax=Trypanozoon TaxID=39700 RepID=Q385L4_TRYB2|nr:hypothetical protein, conserved [Trypanosoma brucei gambiense DAL972]XP_828629.1 hypothetical protein, conserved [Trypanosoma brucei brucei TREU927]EAN79517.1 hypothetical protein, conserved [Trypanosoma brucei brucei TREU927]CBH17507.1 hypothetical protein, conserved [Trypanosoma brucei gambiense DAL972]SCU66357.1 emp24/gp25L/p24 family/GOLD, putative [Trypanosoma equiperdum]|eukprot:XP_011779771.1 hypothetical protein, conserved [Trypanosoma brucei gambiense DAL972]